MCFDLQYMHINNSVEWQLEPIRNETCYMLTHCKQPYWDTIVMYTRYNTPNKVTVKMYAHQSCKITCKMKICQSMRLLRTDSILFASRNGPTIVTKLKLDVTKRKNNEWKILSKRDDIFTKQNFSKKSKLWVDPGWW